MHLRLQTDLDGMGAPPKLLLPPLPPLHRRGAWGASGAKEDVVVAILGSGDGLCASAPGARPFRGWLPLSAGMLASISIGKN